MTFATTQGQMSNQAGGMIGLQIFWALMYLITFTLLLRHCPSFLVHILEQWPLVAFVGLAVLSTLWSDNPAITFRRSVALCFTVVFGFYLANRYSLKEQLRLLAWMSGVCIFFSVPFQLLHVGSPVSDMLGAWYGIFVDKSIFGMAMALSVVIFMLRAKAEPNRRWHMRLGMLSALVMLLLSRSETPLVTIILMVFLLPLSGILRKKIRTVLKGMTLAAVGGAGLLFVLFTHWGSFTNALGRGQTMSGRLQLWAFCAVMALQKPWLGYGYSAFWSGMNGPSYRIIRAFGIPIAHAHNAFLQTWLDLGLLGLALLVLILVVYPVRAALLIRRSRQPEATWPLMVFAFIFLFMLTDVPIPVGNSLYMMIFISSAFAVSSPLRQASSERALRAGVAASRAAIGPRMTPAPETGTPT